MPGAFQDAGGAVQRGPRRVVYYIGDEPEPDDELTRAMAAVVAPDFMRCGGCEVLIMRAYPEQTHCPACQAMLDTLREGP